MSDQSPLGPQSPARGLPAFKSPQIGPPDALASLIAGADPEAVKAANAQAQAAPPTDPAVVPLGTAPREYPITPPPPMFLPPDPPPVIPPVPELPTLIVRDTTHWQEPTNSFGVIAGPGAVDPEGLPVGEWQGQRPPLPGDWGYYWYESPRQDGTLVFETFQFLRKNYDGATPTGGYSGNRHKPIQGGLMPIHATRPCPVPWNGFVTPRRVYAYEQVKKAPLGVEPPAFPWQTDATVKPVTPPMSPAGS